MSGFLLTQDERAGELEYHQDQGRDLAPERTEGDDLKHNILSVESSISFW